MFIPSKPKKKMAQIFMFASALIIFLSLFVGVMGITSTIPCTSNADCKVVEGYVGECANGFCEYYRT
ncbi:unnamed protein product [Trifolium pratense]|uniref:Uncharacterized protein n=1 Tax=Trifolium pratense TaxID=57577 RepID=A0ACB0KE03_TRIPR|nr:unnamed protein product [Trifolium pratense]